MRTVIINIEKQNHSCITLNANSGDIGAVEFDLLPICMLICTEQSGSHPD